LYERVEGIFIFIDTKANITRRQAHPGNTTPGRRCRLIVAISGSACAL
jgi:hypothetical protein